MAGSSSLEGHFGTGLRARFSSAWSTAGCGIDLPWISVVKTEKELLHLEVDLMEHFLDGIAPLGHW